ncbi:MAG: DUF4301 family protein [Deltaproteobacteria bacterium]|nr:DUF4301 family protein [Deltaproteobacteria bacterium]
MSSAALGPSDLRQIRAHGLEESEVRRQLALFRAPRPYVRLVRPCTVGDGIIRLTQGQAEAFASSFEGVAEEGRCMLFVPASGAATRMFKSLLWYLEQGKPVTPERVQEDLRSGVKDARNMLEFIEGIERFAFRQDLEQVMKRAGLSLQAQVREGNLEGVLRFLLTEEGLGYAHLPKGLLKFHAYEEGGRTAFEEHLVEAAQYVADREGKCRLHFTVSPEHMSRFEALLEQARAGMERRLGVSFHVTFSVQKPATDTIAANEDDKPFRLDDGRLLFRPGGHGALIENLNDLRGDIVFMKNIDNVVPDRLKTNTVHWKKVLGGILASLQKKIFSHAERLGSGHTDAAVVKETAAFLREELFAHLPPELDHAPLSRRREILFESLDRPLRVCGMVKNEGEPGGGPFWVRDRNGRVSRQIVEEAQVDLDDPGQRAAWTASTHFNPVDLACGLRNRRAEPFDLRRYVDPETYLVTRKSKDGRELKALEHPGLWNGSMAFWNTLFVEVPAVTFNPVKTVTDLLRPAHQPGAQPGS